MKTKITFLGILAILMMCNLLVHAQGVSINETGTDPDASAMMDIQSTTKGLLIPRMNFAEMFTISSPAIGLLVYCTTDDNFYFYKGGTWSKVVGSADEDWDIDGNDMYSINSGNIGIGASTSIATHKLTIENDNGPSVLRLIGNGSFGEYAKINFGDGDYVFINEFWDDKLQISATGGIGLISNNDIEVVSNYGGVKVYLPEGNAYIKDTPTNADPSAILDVNSGSKGMLIPRMTAEQIAAIANPADGLQVYNVDDGSLYIFVESAYKWKQVSYGSGTIILPIPGCGDPMVDARDGQSYNTIQIDDKCWMAENLNYGTMSTGGQYNDGVVNKACFYGSSSNCDEYGGLYLWNEMMNWTTVEGGQGICPDGWHIPSDVDIYQMEHFLDPNVSSTTQTGWRGSNIGGQLKETGYTHWNGPNNGATNSSGLTFLGAGYRSSNYYNQKIAGTLWSSTQNGSSAYYRELSYNYSQSYRSAIPKTFYFSVRCIKD